MNELSVRIVKWLGVIAAVASAAAAVVAGDVPTAVGIIGASLSSAGVLRSQKGA